MSDVKIPGLVEPKNSKMTQAEIQAMRDKFAKQIREESKTKASDIPDSMMSSYQMTIEEIKEKFGVQVPSVPASGSFNIAVGQNALLANNTGTDSIPLGTYIDPNWIYKDP